MKSRHQSEISPKITPWLKAAGWAASLAVGVGTAFGGWRTARAMRAAELDPVAMQLPSGTLPKPRVDGLLHHMLDTLLPQTHRSLLLSGAVGVLALVSLGAAARFSRYNEDRAELQHQRIPEEIAAEQPPSHGETAEPSWETYYTCRAAELELTRPRNIDEMSASELLAMTRQRLAEPLGNGLYLARSYHRPAYTGHGNAPTETVAALGPIGVDYQDPQGNFYLQDLPTAEHQPVA